MALNRSGRGLGWDLEVNDQASPVLNAFIQKLARSPSQVAPLLGSLGRLGGSLGGLAGGAGMAATSIGGLAASLGPLALAIGTAVFALGQFNDMAETSTRIIETSIDVFAAYETGLAEVGTILRGSVEQMDAVGDAARRMSAAFGVDVQTQLKATYQTMSAGFADATKASEVMTTANKLAVAGVTDVFQSVDLLTTVLNGYGIAAENSIQASDTLFKAVELGKTRVDELAASMGQVTPSAVAAGLSLEETAGAIATLTLGGQSTAMATTSLGRAMDFLSKMPPKAQKAMSDLGIDMSTLDVKTNGLQNVLKVLGGVLDTNERALYDMGAPIRAFRSLMPLATYQSEKFSEVMTEMRKKQGATETAFERMSNTIEFQRRRWAAFKETLFIELGQVFAPVMTLLLNVLEAFITAVNQMPGPLRKLLLSMAALGLSLPVIAKHGLSLVFSLGKLVVMGGMLTTMLVMWGPALAAVGVAFLPLITIAGALYGAWKLNFFGIRDIVTKSWDRIKMTFQAVAAFIRGGGVISGPLAEELAKPEFQRVRVWAATIYQLFQRVKAVGVAAWASIKQALAAVAPVIKGMIPNFSWIVDAFFSAGDASVDLEKKLPIEKFTELGDRIGDAIGNVIRFTVGLMNLWETNFKPTVTWLINAFKTMGTVAANTGVILGIVFAPLVPIFQKIAEFITTIAQKSGQIGGQLLGMVAPLVTGVMVPQATTPTTIPIPTAAGVIQMPIPTGGAQGGAAAPRAQAPQRQPIQINLKSLLELDGDKMGEKMNQFVIDLQSNEMLPEPG